MRKTAILTAVVLLGTAIGVYAAQMTITIPDDKVVDVAEAYSTMYNRPVNIMVFNEESQESLSIVNPEGKVAFAKRMIRKFIKEVYISYKLRNLENDRQAIISNAEAAMTEVTVE